MTGTRATTAGPEDAPDGEIRLPRMRSGPQPQHLLLTLLGDYWYGLHDHLPSAALVALLGEFGISPAAARAALNRLARRGVLESSRTGRHTGYGVTRRAPVEVRLGHATRSAILFGGAPPTWDGQWRTVAFSMPEDQRNVRRAVRARLRWLGFAPLFDGVWVSPHEREEEAGRFLSELGIRTYVVMTARIPPGVPQGTAPLDAWDLGTIRAGYDEFIAEWEPLLGRAREGAVGTAEALLSRTGLMYDWMHFPGVDPLLPEELLPADWPRRRAHEIFAELYDSLGPLAETRVRQIIARFSPERAALVRHHTHRGP
ncbi:PaaX family transcriptional regulator C-terminal domain-containing protein [Actinomadura rugatobispora]|uniref:PaaX family transcriptional regulator C-terminal domain-containing protein n=1 Tax=Actinomadura rugatobispora TaxID=1994 RepID=A0ABW1A4S3_9ACTN|nr:PaaX family transcriptional regulator C-terminal domain-containing protein [Actinomadura rugatobispora]